MSGEETRIYDAIIEEQIALQEMQGIARRLECMENDGTEFSSLVLKIKHQRQVLTRLWSQAHALK